MIRWLWLVSVVIPYVIYEALSRKRGLGNSKSEGTTDIPVQASLITSLDVSCDPVVLKIIWTLSHIWEYILLLIPSGLFYFSLHNSKFHVLYLHDATALKCCTPLHTLALLPGLQLYTHRQQRHGTLRINYAVWLCIYLFPFRTTARLL